MKMASLGAYYCWKRRATLLSVVSAFAFLSSLSGCAWKARVETVSPVFLEDVDISSKLETLPFDHSWVRAKFDGRSYRKLHVKEIRTDLLPEDGWMNSYSSVISSAEDYRRESQEIGRYFREQLIEALQEKEPPRFVIVDAPGSDVLTLEIALTELEFSHPVARAASLAAPVPGTGPALSSMTDPHAAFAARLYDGSGRLVATAADRRFPPARIVDVNKLTATSSAREVSTIWAGLMSEALTNGQFVKTEDSSWFSVLPW